MSKLTGHKDTHTDFIIFQQLTDSESRKECQVNKQVKQLCQQYLFLFSQLAFFQINI